MLLALCPSFSCGGGASSSGEPLSPAQARSVCDASCAHAVTCGWQTSAATCSAGCVAQSNLFRGDGFTAWGECSAAAACATANAGEACYVEVGAHIDARSVHDDYVTRCTAAMSSCTGFPSRVCERLQVILFSDSYLSGQVLPCFALACTPLVACLEAKVLDAF